MQASVAQITLPSSLCTLLHETEPCSAFTIRVPGLARPLTTLCSGCCPSVRLLAPPLFSGLHLGSDYHLTLHPPSQTPGLRPLPASDHSSVRAIAHLFPSGHWFWPSVLVSDSDFRLCYLTFSSVLILFLVF